MATVSNNLAGNQADAQGVRSASDIARRVFESHSRGLRSRRGADLIAEQILLVIDGSGDNQHADILHGNRVAIPPDVTGGYRISENLLRPIIDNAVAQHVTAPMRFTTEAKSDRESRERARVDAAFINHLAQEQDFNGAFAQALYLAMPAGFCPVHRYWRNDLSFDPYEPLYHTPEEIQSQGGAMPRRGMIDVWVGNPFDTVFNAGAKRGSVRAVTYGRVLPADQVRAAFEGNQFTDMGSLEGSKKLPSAALYQRIAKSWANIGLDSHGSNVWTGAESDEELMSLICREIAPGVDPDYPMGRLTVIAVPGEVDTMRGRGTERHAVLLADQPLPAGDFSWTNVYSHHAYDQVTGGAWAEPLAKRQQRYNLYLSMEAELIAKMKDAPTIVNGEVDADELSYVDGYTFVQALGGAGGINARTLDLSSQLLPSLQNAIERTRQGLFTVGGYQAASRGESQPGAAAAKVVFESRADDTIHGPRDMVFRRAVCDFARGCWKQMKTYGDVPWMLNAVGEEYEHLANAFVDSSSLSDEPPQYRLTSAFGATPEARANEVISLSQTIVEGQPVLTRDEVRQNYPNRDLFMEDSNPVAVQRRRARKVVAEIRKAADEMKSQVEQMSQQIARMPPEWQQQASAQMQAQAVQQVIADIEARYPIKRSDDLMAFLAALTELVQDESENPIARAVGEYKLDRYYDWQSMMAQGMGAPMQLGKPQQQQQGQQASRPMNDTRTGAGVQNEVESLTQQAKQGAA